MTTFPTVIDPKEMDLIDKVAKVISPGAWDDRPVYQRVAGGWDEDPAQTATLRKINETNRANAREIALELICTVRDHDAARRAEKEGT
jgi:hypothetical protein